MKIYGTLTSERASKGQGSNEVLVIDLKYEHAPKDYRFFGRLGFGTYADDKTKTFYLEFQPHNDDDLHIIEIKKLVIEKGKRQKDETCRHCGRKHKNALCDDGMR